MLMRAPHGERLAMLRDRLHHSGLDGFVVPLTDEHMSEYVGGYARRLEWLTGFSGSAGSAAVLPDRAAIFIDGRYTLQVRDQVDARLYDYVEVPGASIAGWLGANVRKGARIGHDPWFHTRGWVRAARTALEKAGASLVAVTDNPVDAIWADRPTPSLAPIQLHPRKYTGQNTKAKLRDAARALAAEGADVAILTALDSIAWLFNIRGTDVERTPVARAFAILRADGAATLFAEPEKITPALRRHLGAGVAIEARSAFPRALARLRRRRVLVDPDTTVAAIFDALDAAGAVLIEGRDPCVLPKACKNAVEADGMRAAHIRDGAAISRVLCWLDREGPTGAISELDVMAKVEAIRSEDPLFTDASFDTIAGSGPNGAIVHYRATAETSRRLRAGDVFLLDSGGQYRDGTTDITRTIAIGSVGHEERQRFTRVLKGHIALAGVRFPRGTSGGQLDVLARQALWQAGLDYDHGTGHGVGSFLSVHEGPQRIAKRGCDVVLEPGMILSNEPGFYKAGAYGFRMENLVLVRPDPRTQDERPMLAFETLTLAPIDKALIDPSLVTADERSWLDAYHARVRATLIDRVPREVKTWLRRATAPLA